MSKQELINSLYGAKFEATRKMFRNGRNSYKHYELTIDWVNAFDSVAKGEGLSVFGFFTDKDGSEKRLMDWLTLPLYEWQVAMEFGYVEFSELYGYAQEDIEWKLFKIEQNIMTYENTRDTEQVA